MVPLLVSVATKRREYGTVMRTLMIIICFNSAQINCVAFVTECKNDINHIVKIRIASSQQRHQNKLFIKQT